MIDYFETSDKVNYDNTNNRSAGRPLQTAHHTLTDVESPILGENGVIKYSRIRNAGDDP